MDIDRVAKDAASGSLTRRGVLKRLLGGLAIGAGGVAVLERPAVAAPSGKGGNVNCPPGFKACGSVCRDVNADSDNCGSCGTACPDWQICRNGACVPVCSTGQHVCGTGVTAYCADFASDPNNCGACGNVCASGTCANGTCTAPTACTPGAVQSCTTSLPGVCAAGTQTCGTDGQWGACTSTTAPQSGRCGGLDYDCNGVIDTCPSGETCGADGFCTAACPSGQTLCNGVCVDTNSDVTNCGACGNACPSSTVCQSSFCANGVCGTVDAPTGTQCGSQVCSGSTVTSSQCDGAGACVSVQSSCAPYVCESGTTGCFTTCSTDSQCVVGYHCSGGVCVAN